MMVQLKRGGKLDKLAGLIVGHMSDMKDNVVPFGSSAYEIIASHVNMFEYPKQTNPQLKYQNYICRHYRQLNTHKRLLSQ